MTHLRSDTVGAGEGTCPQGQSYAGAGAGQSSSGGDRAQTRLPLRTNKTVSWASVLEQAFHERTLVEGSGGGDSDHHHLGLGLGLGLGRRGEDMPCRCEPCKKEVAAEAAKRMSTSAPAATTTTTTATTAVTVTATVTSAAATKGATRGTKRKTDQ